MTTLRLRIAESLGTTDADYNPYGNPGNISSAIAMIKAQWTLPDEEITKIQNILEKYSRAGTTTETGISTADVGKAARDMHRELRHNRSVANGYKTFWDAKNASWNDLIR